MLYVQLSQMNKCSVSQLNPVSTIALLEIFSYAFPIWTLACENIRFSSLFAAGGVSLARETSLCSGEERGETDIFAGYMNLLIEITTCSTIL